MPVPYIFANQSASQALPLAYLDANFAYLDAQLGQYSGNFTVNGEITSILNVPGCNLQIANYNNQYASLACFYNTTGLLTYFQGQIAQQTTPAFSIAMRQNYPFAISTWDDNNDVEVQALTILTNLGSPSTAYVGINTATPGHAFDVNGSINASANVYSKNLILNGSSSGAVTVKGAAAAGTWTLTLPTSDGSAGEYLVTDGAGNTSWAAGTVTPGGSNTSVQFNNSGSLGGDSSFVYDTATKEITLNGTGTNKITLGEGVGGFTSDDIGPQMYLNNTNASPTYHGFLNFLINAVSKVDFHFLDAVSTFVIDPALNNWRLGNTNGSAAHYINADGSGVYLNRGNLEIGAASTVVGKVKLYNASNANTVTVQSGVNSASWTMTLPTSAGTNGLVLTTNGAGATSWAAPGSVSQITVANGGTGSTTFTKNPVSTKNYILYGNGTTALSSIQNLFYETSSSALTLHGASVDIAWTTTGVCQNIASTSPTFAQYAAYYSKGTSPASFTGVITPNANGTGTLTVSSVSGVIAANQYVSGAGVANGTIITGGSGSTWTVNLSQSVASSSMSSVAPRLLSIVSNTNAAGSGDGFYTTMYPALPYAIIVNANATPTEALNIDSSANVYIENGTLWQYTPAPTAVSGAVTLSAAEVRAGIISATGTSYTVTLPTGAALDTLFAGVPATGIGFDFSVVNAASGTVTIAVGASGMTSVGTLTVATGLSATFRLRRTATNTYVLYRMA